MTSSLTKYKKYKSEGKNKKTRFLNNTERRAGVLHVDKLYIDGQLYRDGNTTWL